jgi:peptide/nickel transport system substrate-binding protein
MNKNFKKLTRREFLELAAAGAAGTAALSLGLPAAFASTPKRGGTATCGMSFLIQTPDPHRYTGTWARQCMAPCWEGLTTPTPLADYLRISKEKGPEAVPDVQPQLAESWDIEKDGTRYVFYLKKGVKFHTGKELDSEDVKWNWERIKDPAHISTSRKLLTMYLESIETPDKYTVVANLSQPYGAFLVANSFGNTVILPKDSIPQGVIWGVTQSFTPPAAAPPGTGPFKMVEYQQKNQAVFERFDDYRVAGKPYLDKIVYKVISQDVPRTMAFRKGDLDYIYGPEPNWLSPRIKGKPRYQQITLEDEKINLIPMLNGSTLTIYVNAHEGTDTPFKDVRVRQALDYCIDREKLANALYGDLGVPMGQGFHPEISPWGFEDIKAREPNIGKAKQLLKEAGYADGVDVEFKITPTWGKNDLMAQIVQQMAKPAGFRIKIVQQVGVEYWANLRKYTFQLQVWTLEKTDPMHHYYPYLHTDPIKPYNGHAPVTGIKDPEMDKLLEIMAGEADLSKRRAAFKKVVERCNEQAYLIPYLMNVGALAWSTRVQGFNPLAYYQPEQAFVDAWIEA